MGHAPLHPYESGSGSEARAPASPHRPLFEMTIKVFGWERGQAEIDTQFAGSADPFEASAGDPAMILDLLQARVSEEIAEAFQIFRSC